MRIGDIYKRDTARQFWPVVFKAIQEIFDFVVRNGRSLDENGRKWLLERVSVIAQEFQNVNIKEALPYIFNIPVMKKCDEPYKSLLEKKEAELRDIEAALKRIRVILPIIEHQPFGLRDLEEIKIAKTELDSFLNSMTERGGTREETWFEIKLVR